MASKFDGLKVFSATKAKERDELGEKITEWLTRNPEVVVVDKTITQSSDSEFHCLTITLFYQGKVVFNPIQEYPSRNNGAPYQQNQQHQSRSR